MRMVNTMKLWLAVSVSAGAAALLSANAFVAPALLLTPRKQAGATTAGPLFLAGFGSAKTTSKGKKGGVDGKLKPKQQWDRFIDMKRDNRVSVAVRIEGTEEWIEVGHIKSKENKYTELAVARQRALIAEHAKRLFPLKISNKILLEWGYQNESGEWVLVQKSVLDQDDVPKELDKLIGYQGTADPSSGFYCVYDGGQLKTN